jgi:hypothetical protein
MGSENKDFPRMLRHDRISLLKRMIRQQFNVTVTYKIRYYLKLTGLV